MVAVTGVVAASLVAGVHTSLAAPVRPDADAAAVARADRLIQQHRADIRASGGDAYQVFRSIVDSNGAAHVRYTRTYRGLRVYGGDFVVHTDRHGGLRGRVGGTAVAADPRHHGQGRRRERHEDRA